MSCSVGDLYALALYAHTCPVPCDYLPKRSYPLFRAREVLEYLALGGAGGSPEGDQSPPQGRRRVRGQPEPGVPLTGGQEI
jgi:hypothetical protein